MNDTLELAEEIFVAEEHLKKLKDRLIMQLVERGETEFFSVNWTKLRQATGRPPSYMVPAKHR